jgi:hypothetical protein
MQRPQLFEGSAGAGKTHALTKGVLRLAHTRPDRTCRVLALTFMHGSRRHLHRSLSNLQRREKNVIFDCLTFDSFAGQLVSRWRSLARQLFGVEIRMDDDLADFENIAKAAGVLLGEEDVQRWIKRSFDVVLVDEAQDLAGAKLLIVEGLANAVGLIAAADEFQNLGDEVEDGGALAWLRRVGDVVVLEGSQRTDNVQLLLAAAALRNGEGVRSNSTLKVIAATNAAYAAACIAGQILDIRSREIVVLTPVGPAKSSFSREVIERLGSDKLKLRGTPLRPFRFIWETDARSECARVAEQFCLSDDEQSHNIADLMRVEGDRFISDVVDRLRRRLSLTGIGAVTGREVCAIISQVVQYRRAHCVARRHRRAMTIHQAKNQEFDMVVVLWPYEVGGSSDRQRRLLYNAITRAKHYAVVVVQDPYSRRIEAPPFTTSVNVARAALSVRPTRRRTRRS